MKWMIALAALIAAADQMIKTLIRCQPQGAVLFSMPPFFQITHCINRTQTVNRSNQQNSLFT